MPALEEARTLVAQLDERYLVNTLVALAQVPTDVPLGPAVFMEPDNAKLVHYVQHVLRPQFHAVGAYDILDVPGNQFVVRYGTGASPASLLLMVYTPTQHHNLMAEPFSGKIARATA